MRKLAVLLLWPLALAARDIPPADAPCGQTAEPARWSAAGMPDVGLKPPLISAHRGGVTLAPENTMAAYEIAFAYGMDVIEIDVRETLDGRYFSMHDADADRTTDGTGPVDQMTAAQIAALNAADYAPWKGGEFDPAPVPFLEEILELAERTGKGIEFDLKSVRTYPLFLNLIAQYEGIYERSYFNASGAGARAIELYQPGARFIFNLEDSETPQALYDEAALSSVFGSRLDKFTPENIAAIHDGCGYVLPHTYDEGHDKEAEQFLAGLAIGIDGAQADQPDVIRAAIGDPVPTKLVNAAPDRVCLVNADNDLGLPHKMLDLTGDDGAALEPVRTGKGGCAMLPRPAAELQIRFSGDATAKSAGAEFTKVTPGRFGGAVAPLLLLTLLGLTWRRR